MLKISLPDLPESSLEIPIRFTAQGQDINPRIDWSDIPQETKEFALICEDQDAPTPKPFVHWLIYGISSNTSSIPPGIPTQPEIEIPILARQGKNSLGKIGYTGPNPPLFQKKHRYQFTLFALKDSISLKAGATRTQFYKSIQGKIITQSILTTTYQNRNREKVKTTERVLSTAAGVGLLVLSIRMHRAMRATLAFAGLEFLRKGLTGFRN